MQGGESIFLDSFKVVELLREEDPQAYQILSQVPVTFHYDNNGHKLRFRRPTIVTDDWNEPLRVYFAPPFQGPLECPTELTDRFYQAFKKMNDIILRDGMMFQHKLRPGECAIFANRRVLHGRQSFDSSTGNRHLKGTYVDSDVFRDRLGYLQDLHHNKTKK